MYKNSTLYFNEFGISLCYYIYIIAFLYIHVYSQKGYALSICNLRRYASEVMFENCNYISDEK